MINLESKLERASQEIVVQAAVYGVVPVAQKLVVALAGSNRSDLDSPVNGHNFKDLKLSPAQFIGAV